MDKVISVLASPLSFIVLISIVITVHELGHYWVGRIFNAAAESFAVGFGKPIFQVRDKRGTRWRVNWLPLGGFVKFVGEIQTPADSRTPAPADGHASKDHSNKDETVELSGADVEAVMSVGGAPMPIHDHRSKDEAPVTLIGKAYPELGPLKRMAISFGGPVANFIFAIVVFAGMGMALGIAQAKEVTITAIEAGTPAETAGFKAGDIVLTAGGRKVESTSDILKATQLNAGEAVEYSVRRDGAEVAITATPREVTMYNTALKVKEKAGKLGLALIERDVAMRRLNPVEAVGYGVASTADALGATLNVMRRLVTGKDGLDKLSGPVGIFTLTDNVTDMHMKQQGVELSERLRQLLISQLQLAALLSIGVGFFNLLPIPMLDGGAVVMCAAEVVTGRDMPEKAVQVGQTIGLVCLGLFALAVTWQDISRLIPGTQ